MKCRDLFFYLMLVIAMLGLFLTGILVGSRHTIEDIEATGNRAAFSEKRRLEVARLRWEAIERGDFTLTIDRGYQPFRRWVYIEWDGGKEPLFEIDRHSP